MEDWRALKAILRELPPDAMIPAGWFLERLGESEPGAVRDLTITEVADLFDRSPSTVRGWLAQGLVTGAYKANNREWRFPPTVVKELQDAIRTNGGPRREQRPKEVDLGSWRRVREPQTGDEAA